MKRNNLTTALVAAIAGVAGFASLASAVDLNPDGLGQALIYPYYTVNKSQNTQFSVVNSSNVGKVVKVRFLEGYNSREVLDFNLYLSAHDVWTASLSVALPAGKTDDGSYGGQLITNDNSCLDGIPTGAQQPFLSFGYDGTLASVGQPADTGPQTIDRTREGYFEVIAMGDVIPGSALSTDITHVQPGAGPNTEVPKDCGSAPSDTPTGIVAPTGGLFGGAGVINVGLGTFFAYNAEAIDGFTATQLYTPPSSLLPSLQSANDTVATAGVARAYVFENGGNLLTVDYPGVQGGRDAVSAVLMADTLYNEYYIDPGFGAASDWVVTFPTKRFYVDKGIFGAYTTPPFETAFLAGKSNVTIAPIVYDREEGFVPPFTSNCPSPIGPTCLASNPTLPYEVNVISFTPTASVKSTVLGSNLHKELKPWGVAGWASLDLVGPNKHALPGGISPVGNAVTLNGLPAVGFYANNVINANAQPGLQSNYGSVFRHRASRSCANVPPTAAGGTPVVAACS
ncbi:MAG: hypothetical protein ABI082_15855 [Dokdonella sp.]